MNSPAADTGDLKQVAFGLGFQSVGVCDATPAPHLSAYRSWLDKGYGGTMSYLERQFSLKSDPRGLLPNCQSIVAVALNYYQEAKRSPGQPRIARYALGRDYHKVIRSKLRKLAKWMEAEFAGCRTRACVDSAPVFERDYARLAGLGFFGKNTMLIDPMRGSWFFIGLLLTTAKLQADAPSIGGCGKCRLCVDACPTGAIIHEDGRWMIDSRRCVSYLTIEHRGAIEAGLATKMGDWTFGCDVCQDVCPFNGAARANQPHRGATTSEPGFLATRDWPSLARLSMLPQVDWDILTRGSAVRRAGYDGIRRNASIGMRNTKGRGALVEP